MHLMPGGPSQITMLSFIGSGVSPGLAIGKAFVYRDILQRDSEFYAIGANQIREEQARLDKALEEVRQSLLIDARQMAGRLGETSTDIFRAQEALISSASIIQELKMTLEVERVNAEHIVRTVFKLQARRFREMNSEMLQSRGDDIDDLSRRLLLALAGIYANSLESLPPNTVLVARHLLPSDTVFLSRRSTVAVLAQFAGPAAHAALLARELGIPCVGGIPDLLDRVHSGDLIFVDGTRGLAVINPDVQALRHYKAMMAEARERRKTMSRGRLSERAVTLDGARVSVMANVRSREDVEVAMNCGADGIGLFRTEPFFLSSKHFPTDKEFAEFLLDALEPARGKHMDIRLLDIGADKNPIYLHLPAEPDPFLGRRGVRLLLEYPELLEAQLRALLVVSQQIPIGILIPMVTTSDDVVQVVVRLQQLAEEMAIRQLPRIGAMLETPAAALSIPELKQHVDFFSIGSNDLTQYAMAAGRENPMVTQYFIDDHPSVLRLIELVVNEAGVTPVSLCGELAGRIEVIPRLLATGIRSLSVPASLVQDVKQAVRQTSSKASPDLGEEKAVA